MNKSLYIKGISGIIILVFLLLFNPISWNHGGFRTVVEQADGTQFVRYTPGMYYAGFFAKEMEYPNQISVSYQDSLPDMDLVDNSIEIGRITIRFGVDATTADIKGIVQYILPVDEKDMIALHNAHRSLSSLVSKRLGPYTKECLQSAAQLLSSEAHYSGGRAQMAQDFIDQLKNGAFLLTTTETYAYDSVLTEKKRVYKTDIQKDKSGEIKRKYSSVKEYGITVADAQITDVQYQAQVIQMLAKKIEASTAASVSRQQLMTAQQQTLTAKATGEKTLVETQYKQRIEQTVQVVNAETQVQLAEQDRLKQVIALKAASLEAQKIKTLADAEAYQKRAVMQANSALEQKLEAYVEVQKAWATAASQSSWVPTYQMGNGGNSGATNVSNMVDLMTAKTAKDLNLNMKEK